MNLKTKLNFTLLLLGFMFVLTGNAQPPPPPPCPGWPFCDLVVASDQTVDIFDFNLNSEIQLVDNLPSEKTPKQKGQESKCILSKEEES